MATSLARRANAVSKAEGDSAARMPRQSRTIPTRLAAPTMETDPQKSLSKVFVLAHIVYRLASFKFASSWKAGNDVNASCRMSRIRRPEPCIFNDHAINQSTSRTKIPGDREKILTCSLLSLKMTIQRQVADKSRL